jgi:hypothetical protein
MRIFGGIFEGVDIASRADLTHSVVFGTGLMSKFSVFPSFSSRTP